MVYHAGLYNHKKPTILALCVPQVYDMMLRDERFYPSFKQHPLYVRMLAELDMLKEPSFRGSDDGDGGDQHTDTRSAINEPVYTSSHKIH